MKHLFSSTFACEAPATDLDDLVSRAALDSQKKADVLIAMMGVFHTNIVSWTTRCYEATTWALGVQFAVVSYLYINSLSLNTPTTIVLATGLCAFGAITQVYLRAAARAHCGNRLAISKCEAALGLYKVEEYLAGRAFFTYSPDMLRSSNLQVIRLLHLSGTAVAVVSVAFIRVLK